ncbi:hypothetical protein Pint_30158 [Pistacia integerrima]|uniref:Uncharacterized protein n=1 Tax=Pistacia integerrima TaxID=434235 RepID=A0ACC0X3V0_9ROSI|nr:hypothetical protein Pint_30158 [Pistacia integerrima]
MDGNSNPCPPGSCKEQNKFNIVLLVASVVSVLVVLAAILAILWIRRRRKEGFIGVKKKKVHILRFTTVYHGYLDNTQVAVKMLSASSAQGYKEFQA